MQLEKQATGIAEDGARFIAPPKRSGGGLAILAGRLLGLLIGVSRHGRHDGVVFVCVCVCSLQKPHSEPKRMKYWGNNATRVDDADDGGGKEEGSWESIR